MRFSTAIHDLRVSGGRRTEETLVHLVDSFRVPLTVHLVFDEALASQPALGKFLRDGTASGDLEVVFHGLSHACPEGTGRFLAFYHKGQAEYLLDDDGLRARTRDAWERGLEGLGMPVGICPPCWMATRANRRFLESLDPLYLEDIWRLRTRTRTVPSPVVSLGSPESRELFGLRLLGSAMRRLARVPGCGSLRVAIHTCDLDRPDSMEYFRRAVAGLLDSGVEAILQREHLT